MLVPILLATALVASSEHLPVHHAAQDIVTGREAPQKIDGGGLNMFAYCDARNQSTIMVTNVGPTALVVEWTLSAITPGYPPDRWSSVSSVEPGKFEGWMSPAPNLHLDIRYDDDGLPTTDSIDAFCPATAGELEGWIAR